MGSRVTVPVGSQGKIGLSCHRQWVTSVSAAAGEVAMGKRMTRLAASQAASLWQVE